MDFSSVCRTCLCTKYLSTIFKEDDDGFSATIFTITGLQIKINDGLPQQMCRTCMKFIQEACRFRQTCKNAEKHLLSIKNIQECNNDLNNLPIHKYKRKKSTEVKNIENVFSVKIEPDFENDDDIPLLQKKLNFTNVNLHSHIEIDTEFVKSDEISDENDDESVKNEENFDEPANDVNIYENAQEIQNQSGVNEKIDLNRQEISCQFFKDEENNKKNESVHFQFKKDAEIIQSKYGNKNASELDLNCDSDKLLIQMEVSNKTETTEYNSFPNYTNNMEVSDYNCVRIKRKKIKNRKHNKNSLLISNIDIDTNDKSHNENQSTFVQSLEVKKENAKDAENVPFLIINENKVTCQLCQKVLSKRSIDVHMVKSHPGVDSRRVKCELCDTYVLKNRLPRHNIEKHGFDNFTCSYCKSVFECKESLLSHVSNCTEKKRKPCSKKTKEEVECDICKKLMQKASLRMHKAVKHAGMGPVCEHCGRRFGNKNRLNEHLRAKHGYEKFKCTTCQFLSASSLAMKNHERRHRGEKPYACDQCGAKFHATHLLSQHKQSHRAQKNMKCDQCPAAFKANNSLHMHKMTCHNNNTYQCPLCPRTYNSRHYAVKHLRNVHRHTGDVGPLIEGPRRPDVGADEPTNVGPKCPDTKKFVMSCTVTAGP